MRQYATHLLVAALCFLGLNGFLHAAELHTISSVKLAIEEPLEADEESELSIYLSSFVSKDATEEKLRQAEQQIADLGRYSSIHCSYSDATVLQCALVRIPLIRTITVLGLPNALLESELQKRIQLKIGEFFYAIKNGESEIEHLQKRIESFLYKEGYEGALVRVNAEKVSQAPLVDINITIDNGAFMRVRNIHVSGKYPLQERAIRKLFSGMCYNFKDSFEAWMGRGFNCYTKEKELKAISDLQKALDAKGYPAAFVRVSKSFVDPLDPSAKRYCKAPKDSENPSPSCVDLNIEIAQGPFLISEIVVQDSQTITLDPAGEFFRGLFGVEFFSRALDTSFVGNKWPADETILLQDLKEAMTFSQNRSIDEREIKLSEDRMREVLQDRGYLFASVKAKVLVSQEHFIHIRFIIKPFAPTYVSSIHLNGTSAFSAEEILKGSQVQLRPRSATNSGHFTQSTVDKEAEKLRQFYISRGYPDVDVKSTIVLQNNGSSVINYSIGEGERRSLHQVEFINAIDALTPSIKAELLNCSSQKSTCEGSAYLPHLLEEDVQTVTDAYHNAGYPYVQVESQVKEKDGKRILTFTILEQSAHGLLSQKPTQPIIGETLINGNVHTRKDVILREMGSEATREDAPFLPLRLDEGIGNLRGRRVFSRVNIQYLGLSDYSHTIYPLVNVIERPTLTLDTGVMLSSDYLFALELLFRERNLLGTMTDIETKAEWGFFWGRRSALKNYFRWPRMFGVPLRLELTAPSVQYYDKVQRLVTERHFEIKVGPELSWDFSDYWTASLEYRYRVDFWQPGFKPASIFSDPKTVFKTFDGLTEVLKEHPSQRHIIEPSLSYVNIDNPFDPKNGFKFKLFLQYSGRLLGQKNPYTILGGQGTGYFTLGPLTFATQLIVRRGLIDDPKNNWWVLKYESDMDALGGDRNVRGYTEGSIGVPGPYLDQYGKEMTDPDNPSQPLQQVHPGNMNAQANIEVRFPLVRQFIFGSHLDGAFFTDLGYSGICTGFFDCTRDASSYGFSVGVGLRLILPPGPLLLDYAISPTTQGAGIFGRTSRFHILFGYPF